MADYPKFYSDNGVLLVHMDSARRAVDKTIVSTAVYGTPKFQRLQERVFNVFRVTHRGLTYAQLATLEQFREDNRMLSVTFQWPDVNGTVYAALIGPDDWEIRDLGAGKCEVKLELWEI